MADYLGYRSVSLKDELGTPASHLVYVKVADTTTVAQLVADAQAYFALVDPVTGLEGIMGNFSVVFPSTGLKTSPSANIEANDVLIADFSRTGSNHKFGIEVPGIAAAMIENGKVKISDSDFIAWKNYLLAAHTGIQACSNELQLLAGFLSGAIGDRKSKGKRTRTKSVA